MKIFKRTTLKGGSIRPPLISGQTALWIFIFKNTQRALLCVLGAFARESPFFIGFHRFLSVAVFIPAITVMAMSSSSEIQSRKVSSSVTIDKEKLFVNEITTLTITVSGRNVSFGKEMDVRGLFDEEGIEVGVFEELPAERSIVNGEIVEKRSFRTRIRALEAGKLELSPVLRVTVVERKFRGKLARAEFELKSSPVKIKISPLPREGSPDTFNGAVGVFSMNTRVVPNDNINPGTPISVIIELEGQGFFGRMPDKILTDTPVLKTYPLEKTDKERDGIRVYTQTVVPLDRTVKSIGPLTFSFFNPNKGEYETISSGPIEINFHETVSGINTVDTDGNNLEIERFPSGGYIITADSDFSARIAPADSALITFRIPENAQIRVIERYGEWHLVEYGKNRGWVNSPDN